MPIQKPQSKKMDEVRIRGFIKDSKERQWFTFEVELKNRELKKGLKKLKPRVQKVENGEYNYFRTSFKGSILRLVYLNEESANGLYKNPENNLPYEIRHINGDLLYRQSIIETKKDIFNRLEKAAIEEGIRNKD